MATIGSINVAITATTEKLAKGLKAAASLVTGFGGKIASIGSVVAEGTFGALVGKFVSVGAELYNMSRATGIAVTELSFLKYASEQTGRGLDVFGVAIRTMVTRGIAPARFAEIAAGVASIKDPLARLQSGIYYFGKRGALAIMPVAQQLKGLRVRFNQLGGSFTDSMAKHAIQLRQSWGDVSMALANVAYEIGDILSPLVLSITDYIASNGAALKQWVSDHASLIKIVAVATTTLSILIPTIYAFSKAMALAGLALKAFRFALLLLETSPTVLAVTAITLAVVGLIYYLNKFFGIWEKIKRALGFDTGTLETPDMPGAPGSGNAGAPAAASADSSVRGNAMAPAIADTSVATHTAAMNDTLGQILEQMKLSNSRYGDGSDRSQIGQDQISVMGVR